MNQSDILKQLQDITKPQQACLNKHCKKEVADVKKLTKQFQKNADAISKKVTQYAIDFKSGKITRNQYIDHIQKEVKYAFKLVDDLIQSKQVKNHTECTLTHCLTEFKNSLKVLIKMLEMLCKQMNVKIMCDAQKGFEKMMDKEKISANEYLAMVTQLFKEAEKMMVK